MPHDESNENSDQTSPAPHMSAEQFRALGHEMIDWIASYYERLEGHTADPEPPVMAQVEPGEVFASLPKQPPEDGEPWDAIMRDVDRLMMPGVTHWQSPNFFGYFPASSSEPAILGDMLSTALGAQGFLWQTCPALTEVEMRITDWLAQMIGLPGPFTITGSDGAGGGVIQCTASDAALVAMIAGRERALRGSGNTPHPGPLTQERGPLTAYTSNQAHSSIVKAAMVAGVGRDNVRLIDVDETLAMRPDALAKAIDDDRKAGRVPFFVCSTLGTTSTCAFDPLRAVGEIAQRNGLWHHVDAAYAGAALVCPEFRWMIDGVELADSFNFNPHKWLLTSFDCSAFWTQDRRALTSALSITPEYLRNTASESGSVIDYRDWQVPLGRRFRALKLWFVIRHYGVTGLQAHIRAHVRLASLFADLVRGDGRFELVGEPALGLVCFRVRGANERSRALLDRLNRSGRMMLTHSVVPVGPERENRFVLRMAIGGRRTRQEHVRGAWEQIQAELD